MITIHRAPNGVSRALCSLARPSRLAALPARTTPSPSSRFSSTTTAPPRPSPSKLPTSDPASPSLQQQQQQQQQQQKQEQSAPNSNTTKKTLRPLIFSTLFLGAGLLAGNIVRFTIAPPPLPDPGTDMDDALQDKLREELDALPVVRDLAAKADIMVDGEGHGGEWVEIEPWGAGLSSTSSPSLLPAAAEVLGGGRRRDSGVALLGEEDKSKGSWFGGWTKEDKTPESAAVVTLGDEKHLVSQALAAMKGFGPARRWVNRATRESVTVFWVGGGLTGWPGVAHGGALATAFCEAFGSPEPAKLTLTYLAPAMASNFFVLKAAPSPPAPAPSTELPPQKDMTKRPVPSEDKPADGGEEWSGTLAAVQGRVCVKAKTVLER